MTDVDRLVAVARGPDADRRAHAIGALVDALDDNDGLVRAEAADALGPLGDRQVGTRLARLLGSDPDAMVRAAAAESLGDLADPTHLPTVVRAVRADPDEAVRAYAAATLGLLHADDDLLRELHHQEPLRWVRGELTFARLRRGTVTIREALAPLRAATPLLAERLLTGLLDLLHRAPVPVSPTDAAEVDMALTALGRRLPQVGRHAETTCEAWRRAAEDDG
jgi:HEAT repeat protein